MTSFLPLIDRHSILMNQAPKSATIVEQRVVFPDPGGPNNVKKLTVDQNNLIKKYVSKDMPYAEIM